MPRTYIRHERHADEVRDFRVYAPWWIDPYWFLTGSSIEKKVMAEFVRRGIYFIYRNQSNTLGGFVDPSWEADFLLPQYRIWIEVQGSYFHSLPGQIETDAFRFAAIEMAGWRPIALWEFDIENRLIDLLDEIPEFYMARIAREQEAARKYGTSNHLPFKVGKFDDQLKGLRAANAKRRKPIGLIFRRRKRGVRRPK